MWFMLDGFFSSHLDLETPLETRDRVYIYDERCTSAYLCTGTFSVCVVLCCEFETVRSDRRETLCVQERYASPSSSSQCVMVGLLSIHSTKFSLRRWLSLALTPHIEKFTMQLVYQDNVLSTVRSARAFESKFSISKDTLNRQLEVNFSISSRLSPMWVAACPLPHSLPISLTTWLMTPYSRRCQCWPNKSVRAQISQQA